jgi:hypothetical protein
MGKGQRTAFHPCVCAHPLLSSKQENSRQTAQGFIKTISEEKEKKKLWQGEKNCVVGVTTFVMLERLNRHTVRASDECTGVL